MKAKVVTVPKVIFSPDRKKRVVIYALDSHTIGITTDCSTGDSEGWTDLAFYFEVVKVTEAENSWVIKFPKKFIRFYWLMQPETKLVVSIAGKAGGKSYTPWTKSLLVTVTRDKE